MFNHSHIKKTGSFLVLLVPSVVYAQHGSGGAGALNGLGEVLAFIGIGLGIILALIIINIIAVFRLLKVLNTIGIILSFILIGLSIYGAFLCDWEDEDTIGAIVLSILSIFSIIHLYYKNSTIEKNNTTQNILDDIK